MSSSCRRSSTSRTPAAALEHFRSLVEPRGRVWLSTPNVLTLAPKGAERSGNPWHVHEYRSAEFEQLCREHFGSVQMFGLFHARRLRAHELALRGGWDAVHGALGISERFYARFTPSISCATSACGRSAWRTSWKIEPYFRDLKDSRYGLGLEKTHIKSCLRRDKNSMLILALSYTLLTLLGEAGERIRFR